VACLSCPSGLNLSQSLYAAYAAAAAAATAPKVTPNVAAPLSAVPPK